MDETYVRVKGTWKYSYRAVDKADVTVDFLLTAKRDRKATLRFLLKTIKWNGTPKKITIDKSGANTAAIESHNAGHEANIEIRHVKYLNNIIKQDHRAIKRLVRPMPGFKSPRVSCSDPCRHRTHAHDPERPGAADGRKVSGTSVLFVGGIRQPVFRGIVCPPRRFATETRFPPAVIGTSCFKGNHRPSRYGPARERPISSHVIPHVSDG